MLSAVSQIPRSMAACLRERSKNVDSESIIATMCLQDARMDSPVQSLVFPRIGCVRVREFSLTFVQYQEFLAFILDMPVFPKCFFLYPIIKPFQGNTQNLTMKQDATY